jgi:hypothetical protein
MTSASRRLLAPPMYFLQKQPLPTCLINGHYYICFAIICFYYKLVVIFPVKGIQTLSFPSYFIFLFLGV